MSQAGTPAAADDDTVQVDLGVGSTTPPLPTGVSAGIVTSTLKGSVGGSLRFSQDASGYGTIGVVELGFGTMALTGTGFDLVRDADPATCALMKTADSIGIASAPGSQGHVNLFGGSFSMDLHTSFAFASLSRATCADPFTTMRVMNGLGRPPLPLRIDGSFRISPALTADGRVRLGKLSLQGPQHDSFVQVHTCTAAPPPAECAVADDAVLTGRLLATGFKAELLVGSAA